MAKLMTLDEAIKHCEEVAEEQDMKAGFETDNQRYSMSEMERERCIECAREHRQLAEWLRELKTYREFADWLVKVILEDDWEESADFYVEVLCRKLTKLGKLKVVDNKYYMEVNADDTNRCEN